MPRAAPAGAYPAARLIFCRPQRRLDGRENGAFIRLEKRCRNSFSVMSSCQDLRIRFVYKEANQNQRKTAKILGISRATLSRHLRGLDHKVIRAESK